MSSVSNRIIRQTGSTSGFTLVELLVVIAIISIVSAIVIPSYKNMNQQYALNLAANQLVQDIRSTQEMALASPQVAGRTWPDYGVYFQNTSYYLIYADDGDGEMTYPTQSGDYLIKQVYYGNNIAVSSIANTGCPTQGPADIAIAFFPPNPITTIKRGKVGNTQWPPTECQNVTFTLRAGSSGPTETVSVNEAGLITLGGVASPQGTPLSAPTITNGSGTNGGVTNAGQTFVTLNGDVTNAGGDNPDVKIYWGSSDGGTNPSAWDKSYDLGVTPQGAFSYSISGLFASTTYYYRTYAENSVGSSWAGQTATFMTGTSTETIRPIAYTDYNHSTTTENPGYAYNGNLNDNSVTWYAYNLNPSISFGTAWQPKNYLWNSATLSVALARTAAVDDQAGVEINDSAGTYLMQMGSTTVAKQTVSVPLNLNDWGGSGFPNVANLLVNIVDSKKKSTDNAHIYIYDIKIVGSVEY